MKDNHPLLDLMGASLYAWLGHDLLHWAVVVVPVMIGLYFLLKLSVQPYKPGELEASADGRYCDNIYLD